MEGINAVHERDLVVRRAQADDAKRVADFVNGALQGRVHIKPRTVIARLGEVGFLVAEERVASLPFKDGEGVASLPFIDGEDGSQHEKGERSGVLLGLMGWHVENLVACVTDLLIWPARERERVGRALFEEMEAHAADLQAEAAFLVLPRSRSADLDERDPHDEKGKRPRGGRPGDGGRNRRGGPIEFCEAFGYALRPVGELPRAWREMAHQAGREDEDDIPVKELRSDRVIRPL